MGAYFVRRNSKDPLYRKVLERYVGMATSAGVTQAVFPEGGLSRDGKLRPPKLGILDYMVRSFDPAGERDIVFVPVGINYDRTFEDRSFLRELDPQAARASASAAAGTTAQFVGATSARWPAIAGTASGTRVSISDPRSRCGGT
jgi:glycerol-3-phosphate O-acyltransferase